jgi:beta-N-acetylhexosaminidase
MTTLSPLMLDLEGYELTVEERDILRHPLVCGIVLFQRNYDSPRQLKDLVRQVREATNDWRLLIAVDQEGGRVQRFLNGFTTLPPASLFGEVYDKSPLEALQLAKQCGWLMASELLAYDIDMSFAPVLDVDKKISKVIGNRSFHRDVNVLSRLADAYVKGMKEAGMAAVGKHFPGHGSVSQDSHHEIPVDNRSFAEIEAEDLQPFLSLIRNGGLAAMMVAHIVYPHVDQLPAGFSRVWLQDILRSRCQFNGLIFSDCLTMVGASQVGDMPTRVYAALTAGCDIVLICNNRTGAIEAIDRFIVPENTVKQSHHDRQYPWHALYGKPSLSFSDLQALPKWQEIVQQLDNFSLAIPS